MEGVIIYNTIKSSFLFSCKTMLGWSHSVIAATVDFVINALSSYFTPGKRIYDISLSLVLLLHISIIQLLCKWAKWTVFYMGGFLSVKKRYGRYESILSSLCSILFSILFPFSSDPILAISHPFPNIFKNGTYESNLFYIPTTLRSIEPI